MKKYLSGILLLIAMVMLAGCNGGGGGSTGSGTLKMSLTDAAQATYKAVYVTIDEVQVHKGDVAEGNGSWQVVASPHKTYNLLELVNGAMATLGISDLASGKYTQIRLILGTQPDNGTNILNDPHPANTPNYIITDTNDIVPLKIPSGYKTGIKLVHEFEMTQGLTVDLVLDFDVNRSIVVAGKSGQYILKPTIKVIDTVKNAILSGTVEDDLGNPLPGALVSAQVYNAQASDEFGKVTVDTSTLTDDNGQYKMYVPAGTYELTAYKAYKGAETSPYGPSCDQITTDYNGSYSQDFQLTQYPVGMLDITVVNSTEDVSISIRQDSPCQAGAQIEVDSLMVSGNDMYESYLPGGDNGLIAYTVVATDGTKTFSQNIGVSSGDTASITFDFSHEP